MAALWNYYGNVIIIMWSFVDNIVRNVTDNQIQRYNT
jgi:hypothetical protein